MPNLNVVSLSPNFEEALIPVEVLYLSAVILELAVVNFLYIKDCGAVLWDLLQNTVDVFLGDQRAQEEELLLYFGWDHDIYSVRHVWLPNARFNLLVLILSVNPASKPEDKLT